MILTEGSKTNRIVFGKFINNFCGGDDDDDIIINNISNWFNLSHNIKIASSDYYFSILMNIGTIKDILKWIIVPSSCEESKRPKNKYDYLFLSVMRNSSTTNTMIDWMPSNLLYFFSSSSSGGSSGNNNDVDISTLIDINMKYD